MPALPGSSTTATADEKAADRACAAKFLKAAGRLLYRKPLTDALLAGIVEKAAANADQLKDFYAGLGIALEDAAAGKLIYERALQRGIGTKLPF